MQRIRKDGLSKRDRLRNLLRRANRSEEQPSSKDSRARHAHTWRSLARELNPLRLLQSRQASDERDIELFVTRLEERRVLNGDMGMLAGIAEITELSTDLEIYDDLLAGDSISMLAGYDPMGEPDAGTFGTQSHDLQVVLHTDRIDGSLELTGPTLNSPTLNSPTLERPTLIDAAQLDVLPTISFSSALRAQGEATNMAPAFSADTFTFALAENSDVGTIVGTANANDVDSPVLTYTIVSGDPNNAFAIESSTGEITVADQAEIDFESTPTFALTVQVSDNNAMMPATDTAVVNVNLSDLQTTLTITDATDVETSGVLLFDITAAGDDINQAFDVTYQTIDGTAVNALSTLGTNDFNGTTSSVVAFDGDAMSEINSVSITLNDDNVVENDENFLVNLLSASSNDVTIAGASATGTITNDDATVISISDVVQAEGDAGTTQFDFLISSSAPISSDVTLLANTIDASAIAGTDYTAIVNELITISAGTNSAILSVQVTGETDVEVTETFTVQLSSPTFAGVADASRVIIDNEGTGAILDDDLANRATLSIDDVSQVEGDSGATNFVFTISSDLTAQEDISVTVNTSDLFDAVGGSDYTSLVNQTATITQGTDSTTVTVLVATENSVELNETFSVTLSDAMFDGASNPSRVILGDETGIGTIVNDDAATISISDVAVVEGDSGAQNLTFVVSTDAIGSRDIDVRVNTADLVGAVAGADYAEIVAQTAVISAGALSTNVTVAVVGDTIVEADETLQVLLSSVRFNGAADASRVALGDAIGDGTITNDDSTTIAISDVTRVEGDGGLTNFDFTLTTTSEIGENVTVTVNTAAIGETISGNDFVAISAGVGTIAAGSTTGTLSISVAADSDVELTESFSVTISDAQFDGVIDPSRVTITDAIGEGTIIDDDSAAVSIDDVSVVEGDSGTTNFVFTISSDVAASRDLTVTVGTAADQIEAAAGDDFTSFAGQTATIAAGTTSTTVTIAVAGDQLVEVDETFSVNLSNLLLDGVSDPTRATIADATGIGTIINDDVALLSINDVSQIETDSGSTFVFTVTSNRLSSKELSITANTTDLVDAVAGTDYTSLTNQVASIAAGMTTTTFSVEVAGDQIVEIDETFAVSLSAGTFDGTLDVTRVGFAKPTGVGTIQNDDIATLSIDSVSQTETNGITDFVFTISSTLESSRDLAVTVNTQDVPDAIAGTDYAALTNQIATIGAGTTTTTIAVSVTGDMLVELDETFLVNLSSAQFNGATDLSRVAIDAAGQTGTGTIENDDLASLSIDDVTAVETDAGTNIVFTVSTDVTASRAIAFDVDTVDGLEALAGIDYTALNNITGTIAAGGTTTTVTVAVAGDQIVEIDETFDVVLTNGAFDGVTDASRVGFAKDTGTGTIQNDDSAVLSIDDVSIDEGDSGVTNFVFTITSSAESSRDLTATINTTGIDAVAGIDFTALTNQIASISAGSLSTTITVQVTGETEVELSESFSVALSDAEFDGTADATRVRIGTAIGTGVIVNDDTASLSIDDVTMVEGDAGDTNFIFTISTNVVSDDDLTVNINTATLLEAVSPADFTALTNQIATIQAGTTSTTVTVTVAGDALVEADETFTVNLTDARYGGVVDSSRVTIGDATGVGTIANDDAALISISDVSQVETNGSVNFVFDITSDLVASKDVQITVNTADLIDALGGTDYTQLINQTATITAGTTTTTVVVNVLGEQRVETDETFAVNLSTGAFDGLIDASRVAFADASGIGTIINDDLAQLSISDVSMQEGNSGTTNFDFVVQTDSVSDRDLTVTVNTNDLLESVAGTDYTALSNATATILAGETSTIVTVAVTGDTQVEIDETFEVRLSDARFDGVTDTSRAAISDGVGLGRIENDDVAMLSVDDISLLEGPAGSPNSFVFTVTSSVLSSREITFDVSTSDGTAIAPADYAVLTAQPGAINIGATSTTFIVSVEGDDLVEADETFTVALSNVRFDGVIDPTSAALGDATGAGTILNDDLASLSIDSVTAVEGDVGTTTSFAFTITTDTLSSEDIAVTIDTAGLVDAVGGADFNSIISGTATITAGTSSTTVVVDVTGENVVEVDETFAVNLSNGQFDGVTDTTRVSFANAQGVGTITNDDSTTVSIGDVSLDEGNAGNTLFDFTVTLGAAAGRDVSVQVDTADLLEAVAGVDYVATSETVTIAAGSTTASFSVEVIGETILEIDETFTANLTNATFDGATDATRITLGDTLGLGTIVNDDGLTLSIDDVALIEGDTGTTTGFVFTISSTAAASRDINVTYQTSDLLGAIAGVDYTAVGPQTATITAGMTSTTITVDVLGDDLVEINEQFAVDLSNATIDGNSITIADTRGEGTILNDEIASLSVNDISQTELDGGSTTYTFTITSDNVAENDIDFDISTLGQSATSAIDFTALTAEAGVITAGTTSTTVDVIVLGDLVVENDETFLLQLSNTRLGGVANSDQVALLDADGLGTIVNNDSTLLTIDDVVLTEGTGGTTVFQFTIASSAELGEDVEVAVSTATIAEAVVGVDFIAPTVTATISAGTLSTTIDVNVIGDTVVELDEVFAVDIANARFDGTIDPARVLLGDSRGEATILNDDAALISIDDVSMLEGNGPTTFQFTISSNVLASRDLGVDVQTSPEIEAIAGLDFTTVSGPATISAGSLSTTFAVQVLGDQIVEIDETFNVDLSTALFNGIVDTTRADLGDSSGLGTIENDDTATLSINDVTMIEGDSGLTAFTFTISSDLQSSKDLRVLVNTQDGVDAVGNTDYSVVTNQTAIIDAGSLSTTVTVNVVGDLITELDETFTVDLTTAQFDSTEDATRATIGNASGLGTITNDDTALISIDDVTLSEGDNGTTAFTFTISSSNEISRNIDVQFDTLSLTEAIGGTDYIEALNQNATIAAGSQSTQITVEVTGDTAVEIDEEFAVDLTNLRFNGATDASRADFTNTRGVGQIVNDDSAVLSIDNVTLLEGALGDTTSFEFTISSDVIASRNIEVTVSAANGFDALIGTDYTFASQTATIAAGTSSTNVTVSVIGDGIVEFDETFLLNLANPLIDGTADPSLVTIDAASATGTGTILNDDTASLSINDVTVTEGDTGTTNLVFTINSSAFASRDITTTVNTNLLTEALAGVDYEALVDTTATISAGTDSTTVAVTVLSDELVEIDETFAIDLTSALFDGGSDPSRVIIVDGRGEGTIANDDTAELTINSVAVTEGDTGVITAFEFTITSTNASSKDLTVDVASFDGFEANTPSDYGAIATTALISAGTTSTTLIVDVIGDALVEHDETFELRLSNSQFNGTADATRAQILTGGDVGTGTILNDDLASISIDSVTRIEGDAGTTTGYDFTITSDAFASQDLTIRVDTATLLDAVGGADFTAISNLDVVIAAGTTSTNVSVDVFGDTLVELDETFAVDLSNARFDGVVNPTRVSFADSQGTGTITNDDSTTLSISDVSMAEGTSGTPTAFIFTVTSTEVSDRDIIFAVNTTDLVEAVGGIDYDVIANQDFVLAAGQTNATVAVSVNAETIVEIDETFLVTISNERFDGTADATTRVSIADDSGLGTIENDDATTLSINDVTLIEGDAGATDFVFTVTSDAQASRNIDFTIDTQTFGEAIGGDDFAVIVSQSQRIDIGSTTTDVTVTVIGDTDVELDETFSVVLSDAILDGATSSLLTISDDTGVGTIANDDLANLTIDDVALSEGDSGSKAFTFTITSDAIASRDIQVQIDTNDLVDAIAGVDYVAISEIATIAAGTNSTTVTVQVTGDTVLEINETFSVDLTNVRFDNSVDVTRVAILDTQGIGVIQNDDGLTVAIDDVALVEGDSGTTTAFVFTISATDTSSKDIQIDVSTSDFLDAIGATDYTSLTSQTAVIVAGDLSTTVTVNVTGDDLVELDETFTVDLSNAQVDGTLVTIADARGLGTIINDETALLSIDDVSVQEGDTGAATLTFTVSSDRLASEAISATINTADLVDAVGGVDYGELTDQNIVIAAGDLSTTFAVTVVGDTLVESDETILVELTNATFDGDVALSRATIFDSQGIGTISNDDSVSLTINDVTLVEADNGVTNYVFTITSDGLASKDLTATVNVPDRMDSVGAPDLNAIVAQTARIVAGETQTTITVEVLGDLVVENNETFSVNLTDAAFDAVVDSSRVTFVDNTGTGTVIDNDSASLSINDVAIAEGATGFTDFDFVISTDAVASEDLSVVVNVADLMNTVGGSDLNSIVNQTVTINAGETTAILTLQVAGDLVVENDETFLVNLTDAQFNAATDINRVTIGDNQGVGTILNDDAAQIAINDVSMTEGDAGFTNFVFQISSDATASEDLSVVVNAADLMNTVGGSDLTAIVNQAATIIAGETTTTITVQVAGDLVVENDEDFIVNLSDAQFNSATDISRLTIADAQGVGTIQNDDSAQIAIDDVAMNEGDAGFTDFVFQISTDATASENLTIMVNVEDLMDTIGGSDLNAIAQTVTINAGETTTTLTVQVAGDVIVENDEDFLVNLTNAQFHNAIDITRVTISDDQGIGTIQNDDSAQIAINDVVMAEGDTGFTEFTFQINADAIASEDLTVVVSVDDLMDTVGGSDLNAIANQTVTINAGESTATLTVQVAGDMVVENDEDFFVNLTDARFNAASDVTRVTIADDQGIGTIENDDSAQIAVNDVSLGEGDTGLTDFVFQISSDAIASEDVSVVVNVSDLMNAVGGPDLAAIVDQTVTINAGETTTTLTVQVAGDLTVENNEDFFVNLNDAQFNASTDINRVTISDDQGLGTIQNDDSALISIDDVSLLEGDSGFTDFFFTISSDSMASEDLSVNVNVQDLLNTVGGSDLNDIANQTITINAGETTTTLAVQVAGDVVVENDETFLVNLADVQFNAATDVTRVTIDDAQGIGTIQNDDSAQIAINDVSMNEGDTGFTDFVFQISTDAVASEDLSVVVNAADLMNVVGGSDLNTITDQTVTITAGETTAMLTVQVAGDSIVENDEDFLVNLTDAQFNNATDVSRVIIGDDQGIGTIQNDDSAQITINDVSMNEGDAGITNFAFQISTDAIASEDLSVVVNAADLMNAVGGSDLNAVTDQTVTISAGETTATLIVQVAGDSIVEQNEDFLVNLSDARFNIAADASRVTIGDNQGVGTIQNDDSALIAINDVSVHEGDTGFTDFVFTISSSATASEDLSVVVNADDLMDTIGGSDLNTIANQTVTINAGETTATITVQVAGDLIVENDEDFLVILTDSKFNGATDIARVTIGDDQGVGTILNDDSAQFAINDVSMTEGDVGLTDFVFQISSNAIASEDLSVVINVADLMDAVGGSDLNTITNQRVTINAGETTTAVTVQVVGDLIVENDEDFLVNLTDAQFNATSDVTRVTIGDDQGIGTIENDDSAKIAINDVTMTEGDSGFTDFVFQINSDAVASEDLSVVVNVADLMDAVGGDDLSSITNKTITIDAGTATATLTVQVMGDLVVENDETFVVNLDDAQFGDVTDTSRVTISDDQGIGTIQNDDSASLSINDVSTVEGDAGFTDFIFQISSDAIASEDFSILVNVDDLMDTVGGSDLNAIIDQTVILFAGDTTATVTVQIAGDMTVENDEEFLVNLSQAQFGSLTDATRVSIDDAQGLGTIQNDDSALLSIDDVVMTEGDAGFTDFVFTISSDSVASENLTVTVDVNDLQDVIGGSDLQAIVGQTATINAGTTATTITVQVAGDLTVENDETFLVNLLDARFQDVSDDSRVNVGDGEGQGTIENDDAAVVSIDDVSTSEGDAGFTDFVFTVRTDAIASEDLTFVVDVDDLQQSIGGSDLNAIAGQIVTITAGDDSTTLTVQVAGDRVVENDENFTVSLTDARFDDTTDVTRVNIGDGEGQGTIENDDSAFISIDDVSQIEGDTGLTDFVFTISSDAISSEDLTVTVDAADLQDAIGGSDLNTIVGQPATIAAGSMSTTITVQVAGDLVVENDEQFSATLSNALFGNANDASRVNIGDDEGIGVIENDDTATISINDVSATEGDSGLTEVLFTVSSDALSSEDQTVVVNVADLQDLIGGSDLIAIDNSVATISAGSLSTNVTVQLRGDTIVEQDETYSVELSDAQFNGNTDASRTTIGDSSGQGTIVNDDTATLSINDVSLVEGNSGPTTFVFTISSDLLSSEDVGVTVDTNDLAEALDGTDYTVVDGAAATIRAGENTTTISVDVIGDEIVEIDESFTVNLSDAVFSGTSDSSRVVIGDTTGQGTIINDDQATLTIDNVVVIEGDTGSTQLVFTVSSDAIASKVLSSRVNTSDLLEAVAGTDYVAITNDLITIAAGQTSSTITVDVLGDTVVEIDETFNVNLTDSQFNGTSDASRVVIGDGVGQATILNDDQASLSINDVSINEGDDGTTSFAFTISSDLVSSKDIAIDFTALDLSDAVGGPDLIEAVNQSATINAGSTSTIVTIDVLGDSLVELDEVFNVDLANATFDGDADTTRVLIGDARGVGTIINDDTATISINDVSAIEGDSGTTSLVFTISMDNASSRDTSLTVRSEDGDQAVVNADYTGIPNQDLVITAGQTTTTLTVEVIGDAIVEIDETLQVILSDALFDGNNDVSRILIGDNTGLGTIVNDDSATISIEDVTAIEGDNGITDFVFTIRQDALASQDTSVVVNTTDIAEALAGIDYNSVTNQVVTIAAGTRTATLSVGVIGETLVEATETFRVDLSGAAFDGVADASRITIDVGSGIATILNDDAGSFLVDDLIVNEADGTAELTVSITSPIDVNTTLDFSLEANDDIQNINSQITFRAGASQTQSIQFTITDDLLVEGTERYIGFFELMTQADGREIAATVATQIDVIDNDQATFSFSDVSVDEAAGTATLTVATDSPFDIDATFDLSTPTQNDIVFADATTTFAAGSTEAQTVTVTINDDQLVELDELIDIQLLAATDLGDRAIDVTDTGQIEIIDNDAAVFTIDNLTIREGDGTVAFTVNVDNAIDIDTTLGILLSTTDDLTIEMPTVTFAAGSNQSQDFQITVVDDTMEELTERFETLVSVETDLGTRSVSGPGTAVLTVRDNDTPDFLQDLNENILTSTVPILVPNTSSGGGQGAGNVSGSGGDAGSGANGNAGNQAPADAGASDGSPDATAAEEAVGNEPVATVVSNGQSIGTGSSQSGGQSLSNSDSSSEYDNTSSNESKNDSTDSELGSDEGELLFHVVLPNGKLGKKFDLDIELLNDSSLFDRFRGLPTDVYRVLYREPGSDAFQVLFEIYVVDGKIETVLYSPDAPVEQIDPADDRDGQAPAREAMPAVQPIPVIDAENDNASIVPDFGKFGRLAGPMLAASLALTATASTGPRESAAADRPLPKMDKLSRTVRRLFKSLPR